MAIANVQHCMRRIFWIRRGVSNYEGVISLWVFNRVMKTGGWPSGFKRAFAACFIILLVTVLYRNSMCPMSMLIHRQSSRSPSLLL